MPTVAQIVSDVELQLYQASPSDDAELPKAQIKFWIGNMLNALIATELNEKLARQQMFPHVYITKETIEEGEFEDDEVGTLDRVYFELDNEVLALNNGGGIVRIVTEDGTPINRASVQTMNLFNVMRFAKPSEYNLLYSHEGDKVYIEGFKESDIPFDSIEIWYVAQQDILNAADTYEIKISDLTLPMLIAQVVEIGKRELYGSQQDLTSDGIDPKQIQYHTAIQRPQ